MRQILFAFLDILAFLSLLVIVFILLTGGLRIDCLNFDIVSLQRPLIVLLLSLGFRQVLLRVMKREDKFAKRFFHALNSYPLPKLKLFIFLFTLTLMLLISSRMQPFISPTGDEPHYLMITQSLARDGDVNLLDNFQRRDYLEFYSAPLRPHARVHTASRMYSGHGLGAPLLLLPGYFCAGIYGAYLMMNLCGALLTVVLFSLLYSLTENKIIALALAVLSGFTAPLVFYANQLYPELPAALIVAYLFLQAVGSRGQSPDRIGGKSPSLARIYFLAVLLVFLPWLHVKYFMFSIIFIGYFFFYWPRRDAFRLALVFVPLLLLFLGFVYYFYRAPSLVTQYLKMSPDPVSLAIGVIGNLIDRNYGLFVYSPYFLLLGAGTYLFFKRDNKVFYFWLLLILPFYCCISVYYHWYGGYCPPLRYLTPIVPLLIVPLAYLLLLRHTWPTYSLIIICGWYSLYVKNILIENPLWLYQHPGETNILLGYLKEKGLNLNYLFPSFSTPVSRDWLLAVYWVVFLAVINVIIIYWQKKREDVLTKQAING